MRNTKQKSLILSIVNNSYNHPSTEEIYNIAKKEIETISLGTVYRNLNILVDQGLIKRIKTHNNVDRYDHVKHDHAHFICRCCNKIIDLDDSYSVLKKTIGKNKVLDYELNYNGICEECQKKEKILWN